MNMASVYFVSGIDTGIGKTYVTGYLAKLWRTQGQRVITQKFIQTGNEVVSEDIEAHRKIMGCGWLPEDKEKLTMPVIFPYPASPHLAAQLAERSINIDAIEVATKKLITRYDTVLLEGAGGLMVPINSECLTLDYVAQHDYPVILVTSGRLGSINHTLLSLTALRARGVKLFALAYNWFGASADQVIANDTAQFLHQYLQRHHPEAQWLDIPVLTGSFPDDVANRVERN